MSRKGKKSDRYMINGAVKICYAGIVAASLVEVEGLLMLFLVTYVRYGLVVDPRSILMWCSGEGVLRFGAVA